MNGADSIATPMKTSSVPTISRICAVEVRAEEAERSARSREPVAPPRPAPEAVETAGRQLAPSCTAAIGGRASRERRPKKLASRVTMMPTSERDDDRAGLDRMPLFGSVKPTASKSVNRPFASARPTKRPTTDARTPITSASNDTAAAPGASTRRASESRELARALRDRDRERVGDHERADEERDSRRTREEVGGS